jgi:glycosyltransferase involved in cell wall biosynthesis
LPDRPTDRAVIGFLGRIHPHKGLHVLIESLGCIEGDGLELRIAGTPSTFARDYADGLVNQTRDDPRIRWLGGVAPDCTLRFLAELDVLVVPYLGLETGPMTVLEAWAAGTPVIGSNRGGIAEWIEQFGGGQLFPPGDSAALTRILAQGSPTRFSALRAQVPREVRRMSDVADEMVHLYIGVQKSRKDRYASID